MLMNTPTGGLVVVDVHAVLKVADEMWIYQETVAGFSSTFNGDSMVLEVQPIRP